MSVFMSTGELSGDIYAAKLVQSLGNNGITHLWGMVGKIVTGVDSLWDNDILHIMGLGRIIGTLPKLYRLRQEMAQAVVLRHPEAVILIDSPDFHIPLAAKIRSLGYNGPVVFVSPPTIWAWRPGRAKYLKKYCTLCLPLFDFEDNCLKKAGVNSYWAGHPLVDDFTGQTYGAVLPADSRRVALLPGSRTSEIRTLLPVLEQCGREFIKMGLHPMLSVAPGLNPECQRAIRENHAGIPSTDAGGRELMAASRFVVGSSGTAAVEAMMLDRMMLVMYRGSWLEWNVFQLMRRTPFVSIPNVLAGHMVFPELLQDQATMPNVVRIAWRYLSKESYRLQIHTQLTGDRLRMGKPGVAQRWANAICRLIGQ